MSIHLCSTNCDIIKNNNNAQLCIQAVREHTTDIYSPEVVNEIESSLIMDESSADIVRVLSSDTPDNPKQSKTNVSYVLLNPNSASDAPFYPTTKSYLNFDNSSFSKTTLTWNGHRPDCLQQILLVSSVTYVYSKVKYSLLELLTFQLHPNFNSVDNNVKQPRIPAILKASRYYIIEQILLTYFQFTSNPYIFPLIFDTIMKWDKETILKYNYYHAIQLSHLLTDHKCIIYGTTALNSSYFYDVAKLTMLNNSYTTGRKFDQVEISETELFITINENIRNLYLPHLQSHLELLRLADRFVYCLTKGNYDAIGYALELLQLEPRIKSSWYRSNETRSILDPILKRLLGATNKGNYVWQRFNGNSSILNQDGSRSLITLNSAEQALRQKYLNDKTVTVIFNIVETWNDKNHSRVGKGSEGKRNSLYEFDIHINSPILKESIVQALLHDNTGKLKSKLPCLFPEYRVKLESNVLPELDNHKDGETPGFYWSNHNISGLLWNIINKFISLCLPNTTNSIDQQVHKTIHRFLRIFVMQQARIKQRQNKPASLKKRSQPHSDHTRLRNLALIQSILICIHHKMYKQQPLIQKWTYDFQELLRSINSKTNSENNLINNFIIPHNQLEPDRQLEIDLSRFHFLNPPGYESFISSKTPNDKEMNEVRINFLKHYPIRKPISHHQPYCVHCEQTIQDFPKRTNKQLLPFYSKCDYICSDCYLLLTQFNYDEDSFQHFADSTTINHEMNTIDTNSLYFTTENNSNIVRNNLPIQPIIVPQRKQRTYKRKKSSSNNSINSPCPSTGSITSSDCENSPTNSTSSIEMSSPKTIKTTHNDLNEYTTIYNNNHSNNATIYENQNMAETIFPEPLAPIQESEFEYVLDQISNQICNQTEHMDLPEFITSNPDTIPQMDCNLDNHMEYSLQSLSLPLELPPHPDQLM